MQLTNICLQGGRTKGDNMTLIKHGTCAFGVEVDDKPKNKGLSAKVGYGDIRAAIAESIIRFTYKSPTVERVGTMGRFHLRGLRLQGDLGYFP